MPYGIRVSTAYRTLLLLRHAKSDYPQGVVDHDRPLAPRGEREAGLAGTGCGHTRPPSTRFCARRPPAPAKPSPRPGSMRRWNSSIGYTTRRPAR
jgi:hypothetical protein